MTKKDFQLIAGVLSSLCTDAAQCFDDEADRRAIAQRFADALGDTNPRFDRAKFLDACGLNEYVRS